MSEDNVLLNDLQARAAIIAALQVQQRINQLMEDVEEDIRKRKKIRPRRWYVRQWILEREEHGHYHQLLPLLRVSDPDTYRNYLRVDHDMFTEILERIKPHIEKQNTNWKKALEPGLRLAITLRFLASGDSYKSLALNFRVGWNSISQLVPETCEAIITEYLKETIVCPATPDGWKRVAEDFAGAWDFHHTLGAIDGKHVAIQPPPNCGSVYYNYKGYHSIVLLALADAQAKFMWVDVGANGSCSDAGIFQDCHLRQAMEACAAGVPDREPLPGDTQPVPYFVVGDNAFPMRQWLQKPFPHRGLTRPQRNYNYRLSRARRVVENAFGMWANRFRVFLTTIQLRTETVEKLVLAGCILHNMLRDKRPAEYKIPEYDPNLPPGDWTRDPLDGLEPRQRQSGPGPAKATREYLTQYYQQEDRRLSWQKE